MPTFPLSRATMEPADTLFWAGVALAAGAFGVVLASVFYALCPPAAALPIPNPSLQGALDAVLAGRIPLFLAGTIGILSDILLAAGTLLLMVFRIPQGWALERGGWALITLSVLVFVFVDSLSCGVLTQLAALPGAMPTFAGFKMLFDTLFILGAIAFGLGSPAVLVSELLSETCILGKPWIWLGLAAAAVGLISGLLYFVNIGLPLVIGGAVAVGAFVFGVYGIRIARTAR